MITMFNNPADEICFPSVQGDTQSSILLYITTLTVWVDYSKISNALSKSSAMYLSTKAIEFSGNSDSVVPH